MNEFYIFLLALFLNVIFVFYKAKLMPKFRRKYPEEFIKAGSPSWFFEGFNTTTFWLYLGRNEYQNRIDDKEIVNYLDRVKIMYFVNVLLMVVLLFSIEI